MDVDVNVESDRSDVANNVVASDLIGSGGKWL